MSEMVERVAKAVADCHGREYWDRMDEGDRDFYRVSARAAIAAMWGDDPELDWCHKLWQRLGRQAGALKAIIVCTVAFNVVNVSEAKAVGSGGGLCGYVGKRVPNGSDLPTKPREVFRRVGKDIEIFNPTPQIEKLSSLLNVHNILRGDCSGGCLRSEATMATGTWPQMACSDLGCGVVFKIESVRQWSVAKLAGRIHRNASSWCVTTVLPEAAKPPIIKSVLVAFPKSRQTIRENKSPFVNYQRFLRQPPLVASSDPQSSSERRDDDGSDGSNGPAVGLNKIAGTTDIGVNRGSESGWVFFGSLIAVSILVMGYAALKDWRKGAHRGDKRDRQKNKKS